MSAFSYAMDADALCDESLNWHVFRHGWGFCVCGEKQWPRPKSREDKLADALIKIRNMTDQAIHRGQVSEMEGRIFDIAYEALKP